MVNIAKFRLTSKVASSNFQLPDYKYTTKLNLLITYMGTQVCFNIKPLSFSKSKLTKGVFLFIQLQALNILILVALKLVNLASLRKDLSTSFFVGFKLD